MIYSQVPLNTIIIFLGSNKVGGPNAIVHESKDQRFFESIENVSTNLECEV